MEPNFPLDITKTCLWAPNVRPGGPIQADLMGVVREWCDANLGPITMRRGEHSILPTVICFSSEADAFQFKMRWFGIANPRDL